MKRMKISRQTAERMVYIILIVGLSLFGVFKDSTAAEGLIRAVKEAFTLLIP